MQTPRQKILAELEPIAASYGVKMRDILRDCRTDVVVKARRDCMHFVWSKNSKTLSEVARIFGNRDHTSVQYAIGCHLNSIGAHDHPLAGFAQRKQARQLEYARANKARVAARRNYVRNTVDNNYNQQGASL